jgi:hypothetical protein
MSKFDTRVEQLEKLGFKDIRVGYSNEKYAFMYHQIEEITQENWDELIKIIENNN